MISIDQALLKLRPGTRWVLKGNTYSGLNWLDESDKPTEEEINAKIQELEAAEPMRLLREERNRRLQETDWEMMRNAERDINNDELIKYRNDLRDLPALVEDQMTVDESNRNSALVPIIENGQLVFESWPTKP